MTTPTYLELLGLYNCLREGYVRTGDPWYMAEAKRVKAVLDGRQQS